MYKIHGTVGNSQMNGLSFPSQKAAVDYANSMLRAVTNTNMFYCGAWANSNRSKVGQNGYDLTIQHVA